MKKTIIAAALMAASSVALAQEAGLSSTTFVGAGAASAASASLSGTGTVTATSAAEGHVRAYGNAQATSSNNAYHYDNYYYYYGYQSGYNKDYSVYTNGNVYLGNSYYEQDSQKYDPVKSTSTVDISLTSGDATGQAMSGIGGLSYTKSTAPAHVSETLADPQPASPE